ARSGNGRAPHVVRAWPARLIWGQTDSWASLLLNNYFCSHMWMNRTEIGIRARLGWREGELLIGIEDPGLDCLVFANHRVRNVITIRPRDRCSCFDGERRGREAEVIDLNFDAGRRSSLAGTQSAHRSGKHKQYDNRCDSKNLASHFTSPLFESVFIFLGSGHTYSRVESTTAKACRPRM